ncbi:MAG: recombinase family protein [Clostridia bacterium]|nr:recombinase family protein [Clostridia bacterium]
MIRTNSRVALYARFSSDNQRSESIDAQIRAMEAYCKQHHYVIVKTYTDEARSATTDRRPAFQQMVADSKDRIFDILLVHKLDRFARNRYDSAVYKRELKKNGVLVYSVLENLDDSPESIMMESVLEGMSEYYSYNIAREVMKGLKETAYQSKHTGGVPPLGYDVDPESKKLVLNPQEAETVRIIFDLYSRGFGYTPIIDTLYRQGRKTKLGKDFQKNSLYGILTNPKYQGIYVFNRSSAKRVDGTRNSHFYKNNEDIITVEGGCPQIVPTEIFDKVQERIRENRHAGARNVARARYLLSGLVYCKECGRAMVGNSHHAGRDKKLHITYRCPNKRRLCNNKEINRDYLERCVIALLEEQIFNRKALTGIAKKIRDSPPNDRETAKAKALEDLERINGELRNVADAIAAGLISEVLIARLQSLEQEKASAEALLTELSEVRTPMPVDADLIFSEYQRLREAPSSPEYREFIRSFIRRIDVGRYTVNVTLKTGLDVCPALDTSVLLKREFIYRQRKAS